MNDTTTPHAERRALKLRDVRRLLEGVIPPAMCSVGADGMPHVNYLSHAEYIDDEHVALTYQFLNRARANILATGRVALSVEDPFTGVSVLLQLRYERTDTEGPVFERLRAKLAGIAAQTGMEKVFHLRGADVYRVESLRKLDPVHPLPSMAPRCDLATGVRRLSEQLAEAADLRSLLTAFIDGLQRDLRITHAIVWLLDEQRQGLYTLASIGYEQAGSGAELPLAEAGLAGVALRENVPIRIGHMSQMYSYGMSWRAKAEQLGLQAAMADTIPLPGLASPRSQLAVPLRARGRTVGALLVESESDQFFSYDDEDALTAVGAQLAQGLAALRTAELVEEPVSAPVAPATPLIRYWSRAWRAPSSPSSCATRSTAAARPSARANCGWLAATCACPKCKTTSACACCCWSAAWPSATSACTSNAAAAASTGSSRTAR